MRARGNVDFTPAFADLAARPLSDPIWWRRDSLKNLLSTTMNIIKSLFITGTLALSLTLSAEAGPKVIVSTSEGDITLELNEEKAPKTVANFLSYVKDGFFDETVFHRVIKGFMIQGGGFALGGKW